MTPSISPWLIILPIVLIAGWWLARSRPGSYLHGWDWRQACPEQSRRAGLVLGLIGAVAWLVAWPTGWHYGVGSGDIVGATGPFVQALFEGPDVLNWGSFVVLSLPVRAFLAVWRIRRRRQFHWQVPNAPNTLRMLTAGAVMGIGAAGCQWLQHRSRLLWRADPGAQQPDSDLVHLPGSLGRQLSALRPPSAGPWVGDVTMPVVEFLYVACVVLLSMYAFNGLVLTWLYLRHRHDPTPAPRLCRLCRNSAAIGTTLSSPRPRHWRWTVTCGATVPPVPQQWRFVIEQTARSWAGLFINLTRTAGEPAGLH